MRALYSRMMPTWDVRIARSSDLLFRRRGKKMSLLKQNGKGLKATFDRLMNEAG